MTKYTEELAGVNAVSSEMDDGDDGFILEISEFTLNFVSAAFSTPGLYKPLMVSI